MKNEEMMKSGSVWKAIASMAIPSAVIMILMIFYNIADMFFIARLGDNAQVAAVSVVSPVFSIMSAVAMMLGNGGCTMIAKAFGAGEKDKAKIYASLCMWTAIVLALVFIVLALVFADPLLVFLGAKGDVAIYAKKYMIPVVLGSPFMMISTSVALLLRAEGSVMEGFVGNLIGTMVNLILDPIFILVFHWGVAGAALASVAGNALAVLYYIYVMLKKSQVMSFSLAYAAKDVPAIGHILILGLPNAIASILSGFASTFSNQILSGYGTDALAAMAAAGKCTMIATTLVMAVGMGCQALISYNYGAQNIPRLKEVVRKLSILVFAISIVAGSLCFIFRKAIMAQFLTTDVLGLGVHMVTILLLTSPIIGVVYLVSGYFQAIDRPMESLIVSILRQGLLLIPALYICNRLAGLDGVVWAYVVADVISTIVAAIVYLMRKNLCIMKQI